MTENSATYPPKMSRECAAEALLALKVGGTLGAGEVPSKKKCTDEVVAYDKKTFEGTFEVHLPTFMAERDKNLMVAPHRKKLFDVKAV